MKKVLKKITCLGLAAALAVISLLVLPVEARAAEYSVSIIGERFRAVHKGETVTLQYEVSDPDRLNNIKLYFSAYEYDEAGNQISIGYYDCIINDASGNAVSSQQCAGMSVTGKMIGNIAEFSFASSSAANVNYAKFYTNIDAEFTDSDGSVAAAAGSKDDTSLNVYVCNDCADGHHSWDVTETPDWDTYYEHGGDTDYLYNGKRYQCTQCFKEFFSRSGSWVKDTTGWWYKYENGTYPQKSWVFIDGSYYYFNAVGYMQTGWVKTDDAWYYCNASGARQFGWQLIGNLWYYFDASGVMQTGWQLTGNQWYYFNTSGAMQTGWRQIGGKWYYFKTSGQMTEGWRQIGGKWYYFNTSGQMAEGWRQIGGKWYYFNTSGQMTEGWQYIGGSWYYFYTDGSMAADTWIGEYYVNESGIWTTGK